MIICYISAKKHKNVYMYKVLGFQINLRDRSFLMPGTGAE